MTTKSTTFSTSKPTTSLPSNTGGGSAPLEPLDAILDSTGWQLHLRLESQVVGGSYLAGTSLKATQPDRTNDTAKVKLTVTRPGYDSSGNLTSSNATIYGTRNVTLPYGETTTGSRRILSGDMVGVMVDGETITQAGTGATAVVVTNCPCAPLIMCTLVGSPNGTGVWTGSTSAATFTPNASSPTTYTGNLAREGTDSTGRLWITLALSEYIYGVDTAISAEIDSGVYTSAATPSIAASGTITNVSTVTYPTPISRWLTVDRIRQSGAFTVRCQAYARSARNGKPVAAVVFTASDGTTTTTTSGTLVSYLEPVSGIYVEAWEATFNATNYIQGSTIAVNFKAYPHDGNASAITDSSVGTNPSTALGPLNFLCDKNNTFGVTVCYVDMTSKITTADTVTALEATGSGPAKTYKTITQATSGATAIVNYTTTGNVFVTNITGTPNAVNTWTDGVTTFTPTSLAVAQGNDTTGVATNIANDATAKASPCATWSGAYVKIKAYNNTNHGRNNGDCSIVYGKKGLHRWGNTVVTSCSVNWYTTITRESGLSNGDVVFNQTSNTSKPGTAFLRVLNLDILRPNTNSYLFYIGDANASVWFDQCRIDAPTQPSDANNPIAFTAGYLYYTGCVSGIYARKVMTGGAVMLALGNTFDSNDAVSFGRAVVGNYYVNVSRIFDGTTTITNMIVSHNVGYKLSSAVSIGNVIVTGYAEVSNLFEKTSSASAIVSQILADGSITAGYHVLRWQNTQAGERSNFGYNDVLPASDRINWSCKYNSCYRLPTKHDEFTAGEGARMRRIKGWPVMYGLGFCGNNAELTPEPYNFTWGGWLETRGIVAGYVLNGSYLDGTNLGLGNYHLTSGSVCRSKIPAGERVLSYDIEGVAIPDDGTGAAGVYQTIQ